MNAQSPLDIYRLGDEVEVLAGTDVLGGSHVEWRWATVCSRDEWLERGDGARRIRIGVTTATGNQFTTIYESDSDKIRYRSKP